MTMTHPGVAGHLFIATRKGMSVRLPMIPTAACRSSVMLLPSLFLSSKLCVLFLLCLKLPLLLLHRNGLRLALLLLGLLPLLSYCRRLALVLLRLLLLLNYYCCVGLCDCCLLYGCKLRGFRGVVMKACLHVFRQLDEIHFCDSRFGSEDNSVRLDAADCGVFVFLPIDSSEISSDWCRGWCRLSMKPACDAPKQRETNSNAPRGG